MNAGVRIVFLVPALFVCGGCARLATVKQTPPRCAVIGHCGPELAPAEQKLMEASKVESQQPLIALGFDLTAAKMTAATLDRQRNNAEALTLYNFAVARTVENMQRAQIEPWRAGINIPSPEGEFLLTTPKPPDREHDPSNCAR